VIVDLGDIRAADASRVGPKMARLGALAAAGWRVPDGYAITAGALSDWLSAEARAELDRLLSAPPTPHDRDGPPGMPALSAQSARAREFIESQPLPAALADAVAAAHERLELRAGAAGIRSAGGVRGGGGVRGEDSPGAALRVAVRSSAVSEDGDGASFAGQYETYLGVAGVPEVLRHIRKCWASGYSAHALEYRRRLGGTGPLSAHDLAVGVVALVDARSAGVAFTLDPITGDRSTLVVEANWGFGESVVSGHVSPDHWTVDRNSGEIVTRRIGAKSSWSVFSPAAGRVVLEPAPADRAARPCLTDDEVRHLCREATRIEEAAGGVPQDVEWAVARDLPLPDSVFILQHRPETTWDASAAPDSAATAPAEPAPETAPGFDPVKYALRNVFKVPGA
jgi:pyruvate,water dikinase